MVDVDSIAGWVGWTRNDTGTYGGDSGGTRNPVLGNILRIAHPWRVNSEPKRYGGGGRQYQAVNYKRKLIDFLLEMELIDDNAANSLLALFFQDANGPDGATGAITPGTTGQCVDSVFEYQYGTDYRLLNGVVLSKLDWEAQENDSHKLTYSGFGQNYAENGSAQGTLPSTKPTDSIIQTYGDATLELEDSILNDWLVPTYKMMFDNHAKPQFDGSSGSQYPQDITIHPLDASIDLTFLEESDRVKTALMDDLSQTMDIEFQIDLDTHARFIYIKFAGCQVNSDFPVGFTNQCGERRTTYQFVPTEGITVDVKYNA
jgi:hypothetical protein